MMTAEQSARIVEMLRATYPQSVFPDQSAALFVLDLREKVDYPTALAAVRRIRDDPKVEWIPTWAEFAAVCKTVAVSDLQVPRPDETCGRCDGYGWVWTDGDAVTRCDCAEVTHPAISMNTNTERPHTHDHELRPASRRDID